MTEQIPLRQAKAMLSELTERAADGVDVIISKHGRPAARLTAARHSRKPVDLDKLQALVRRMPKQPQGAGRALRDLRNQARY